MMIELLAVDMVVSGALIIIAVWVLLGGVSGGHETG
jgi:hypothetical protein